MLSQKTRELFAKHEQANWERAAEEHVRLNNWLKETKEMYETRLEYIKERLQKLEERYPSLKK